ncbi:hypothetical protein NDU88_002812 [Pleurodeles waltl]|uniref:Uncharacterized protein n=1 Tax=Pleurodeles waltl TaxID=8319 RepID=A0AAV7NHK4_PLEWA|nr:hypothetical protein NDU88_002812 [Pleurodeles waltl]
MVSLLVADPDYNKLHEELTVVNDLYFNIGDEWEFREWYHHLFSAVIRATPPALFSIIHSCASLCLYRGRISRC